MKFLYKTLLFLFISQLFIFLLPYSFAQQNINGSFSFKGNNRTYIIHIPPSYNGSANVPMVLNLHGYNSTATQQQFYAMLDNISDTAGFIVVYPDAVNSVWDTVFVNSTIDDVGFLSALIDTVSKNYKIDSLRIYSTGLSMGGFMTYRLGCELSNRIAAIASVAGPMITPFFPEYDITPSMPVLHIHGTSDSTILFDGGDTWPPVDTVIQYFINKNNCTPIPDTLNFQDINSSDSSIVTKYHFGFCDDSTEVVFYKVFNGGHTWPGALINIPNLGNTNRDMKASAEIWNFFREHKLKQSPASAIEKVNKENELLIFPNPSDGKIKVISNKYLPADRQGSVIGIEIFNILGEHVNYSLSHSLNNLSAGRQGSLIDISNEPKGLYFVKVQTEGKTIIEKIIIH